MKVFKMKNEFGQVAYFLRAPQGLVSYGYSRAYAIMGAGFKASWALHSLKAIYPSLRAAKFEGLRVVGAFNV